GAGGSVAAVLPALRHARGRCGPEAQRHRDVYPARHGHGSEALPARRSGRGEEDVHDRSRRGHIRPKRGRHPFSGGRVPESGARADRDARRLAPRARPRLPQRHLGLHRRAVPPAGRRHDSHRLAADPLPAARLSGPAPSGCGPDAPPRVVHAERRHRGARAAARRRQRARHDAPLARAQREDRPRPGRLGVSVRPDDERQARRGPQRRPRVHRARRRQSQRHRGRGARRETGEGGPAFPDRRPDPARGERVSDQKVCPTCGTEYPLSERFCPRDGTALRSSSATADLIGSIVAERYHILKKLGEGGMGTVYLAEHVKMGRKAALKVMNPGMNSDPDAIARFNREAANASRLNHANVCAIYDFGETPEGLIYLAMEFIEGESLTSLIEKNGFLPAPRAASIIHQAADALALAHDYGIVHRDLKPDNIMIAKGRDGSDMVKGVDFGLAKAGSSDARKVTKTGLVVGTPEYMSPEQLAGDKLDGRSDIYSLGLVAFNC